MNSKGVAPILPGATIGVLGGGQLGRMLALAVRRLGYRIHVFTPDHDAPASQVADLTIQAGYADVERLRDFARRVDVITFEFENIDVAAVASAAQRTVVRPDPLALHVTQHRIREKSFLADAGLPVTPFVAVRNAADLAAGLTRLGRPAVLKTAAFGYDGKGQVVIGAETDAPAVWQEMGAPEAVLEAWIDLDREVSVIGARGVAGEAVFFDPFENVHARHILDVTTAPAVLPTAKAREAIEIARAILEALEYVGVLCVEFFLARDGRLLINEIAPRTHNSGHLTIDACRTSQFEQQVRAVCGLPLGSPAMLQPAAMANILGDIWANGEPDWAAALAHGDIKLHLYGKADPRPGRKMGHLTALGDSPARARAAVLAARDALIARPA